MTSSSPSSSKPSSLDPDDNCGFHFCSRFCYFFSISKDSEFSFRCFRFHFQFQFQFQFHLLCSSTAATIRPSHHPEQKTPRCRHPHPHPYRHLHHHLHRHHLHHRLLLLRSRLDTPLSNVPSLLLSRFLSPFPE